MIFINPGYHTSVSDICADRHPFFKLYLKSTTTRNIFVWD